MRAAVAGATGFIGRFLIEELDRDRAFEKVIVVSRRPFQLPGKFSVAVTDKLDEQSFENLDVGFCTLGTTMARAGSKNAFRHVDHDLVLAFARQVHAAGASTFVLVSSVGADPGSANFYLQVKGRTEHDLQQLGFRSLVILRPSLLMGERSESRPGEQVAKGLMRLLNPLMLGPLEKYRGIHGRTVAKAMVHWAKADLPGVHIIQGQALHTFS